MPTSTAGPDLFPDPGPPEGTIVVDERCLIRTKEGQRIVVVAGIPLSHYPVGDQMAEAYAMVCLVDRCRPRAD